MLQKEQEKIALFDYGGVIMKLQYLGTAAAEGIPAIFCDCDVCLEARKRGGKNIRTRSQAIVDDCLLIDFPADTYMHFLTNGFDLVNIHTCIVTHSHSDHLYPTELEMRKDIFSHRKINKPLVFYSGKRSYDLISDVIEKGKISENDVQANFIKPYESFQAEQYTVTALDASHDIKSDPYVYIIERDGKRILYANDTSDYPKASWEYLEKYNGGFQLVSLDCTEANREIEYVGHMNLERCMAMRERMYEIGVADKNTKFILNHFSHNGGSVLYEEFCKIAEAENFIVSYDGMTVEV